MRSAAIVLIATAAVAATAGGTARGSAACHPSFQHVRRVNLDADAEKEIVTAFESTSCDHRQQSAGIRISDHCGSHWNAFLVSGRMRTLGPVSVDKAFRVLNADGTTARRELFFALHGTDDAGPRGVAKVIRLDRFASGCAWPHILFGYTTASYSRDATRTLVSWTADPRDVDASWPGLEVVLAETTRSQLGGSCCVTLSRRVRQYRYDRRAGRYVVFSDKTVEGA